MIDKSRQVDTTYQGANPGKYYGSVSTANESLCESRGWDEENTQISTYFEFLEKATLNRTVADYIGSERFQSTRFPRPEFNNCTHKRIQGVNLPFCCCAMKGTTGYFYRFYRQVWPNVLAPSSLWKHYSVNLRPARAAAWWTMQPRFEGDISMFNFLLELKDFRELGRLLLKLRKTGEFRRLSNRLRKAVRSPKRRHLDVSRPAAEAHLMNEFAVKPLLSDLVTIMSQINVAVLEAQKEFQEAGLGRNSRHYTEVFPIDFNSYWSSYYENAYPYRKYGESKTLTFCATMEYSYKYSMRSTLDAISRYWGLTPTWEAIWNGIPFSFLVDYFFSVGKSIKAMETDKNVELKLAQYCESLLSATRHGHFMNHDTLLGGTIVANGDLRHPKAPVLVSGLESTLYTRKRCHPYTGPVLPRISLPTSKQGRNLAALLRCFF